MIDDRESRERVWQDRFFRAAGEPGKQAKIAERFLVPARGFAQRISVCEQFEAVRGRKVAKLREKGLLLVGRHIEDHVIIEERTRSHGEVGHEAVIVVAAPELKEPTITNMTKGCRANDLWRVRHVESGTETELVPSEGSL
jgi:hypothetical protein